MEDGDGATVALTTQMNGDTTSESIMANFPEIEVTNVKHKPNPATLDNAVKVNGDTEKDSEQNSPDEDALVIDEDEKPQKARVKRKKLLPSPSFHGFKGFKRKEMEESTQRCNNYIPMRTAADGETCGNIPSSPASPPAPPPPLSSLSSTTTTCETSASSLAADPAFLHRAYAEYLLNKRKKQHPGFAAGKRNKKNPSPKLREYAQYLGLQPTVKFKCSKCEQSSFPSLSALNDHHVQCLSQPAIPKPPPTNLTPSQQAAINSAQAPPSTNFRVTRKVYLCSACGTYYENWNLFLHMREVHKRFICLYCLGMFSQPEKLTYHLVAKHNCNPGQYDSAEDFLQVYKDPCFLMCCDCERVFTEQDNFFGHVCVNKQTPAAGGAPVAPANASSTPHHPQKTAAGNNVNKPNAKAKTSSAKKLKLVQRPLEPAQHVTADMDCPDENHEAAEETGGEVERRNEEPEAARSPTTNDAEQLPAECRIKEEVPENEAEENGVEERRLSPPPHPMSNSLHEEKHDDAPPNANEAPELHDENTRSSLPDENASLETHDRRQTTDAEDKTDDDSRTSNNLTTRTDDTTQEENDRSKLGESEEDEEADDKDSLLDDSASDADSEQEGGAEEPVEDEEEKERPAVTQEKVPPLTLKLPLTMLNNYSDGESDLEMSECDIRMDADEDENSEPEVDLPQEVDDEPVEPEKEGEETTAATPVPEAEETKEEEEETETETIPVAGSEVPVVELQLEQPLDKFCIKMLLKKCLSATVATCVYCNHARKIAVNGKQLGLHAIAEHRFSGTVNSITAEELIPDSFNSRIKECFAELEDAFFNLQTDACKREEDVEEGATSEIVPFDRMYECFQCRYVTTVHKELYLHNRKMHAKTILLCIMCKSNFFSYSELLCHLCPGSYVLDSDIAFRCCLCVVAALPSAFRLMVHLRKRHHTCDVCLEHCHNQSKLSNHVWKHKLHHLCYRCGIAYRNKPDITKHLFWKHGTESVVCKKCLQKKWPHVYHFCIPPNAFVCEECTQTFTKAVALKVHKRLHSNEFPHACTEENCTQTFISKKLLQKHEFKHREPAGDDLLQKMDLDLGETVEKKFDESGSAAEDVAAKETTVAEGTSSEAEPQEVKEKPKVKIDVYDLPALNLSESDSSDSEAEKAKKAKMEDGKGPFGDKPDMSSLLGDESNKSATILDGIWDNFKNYQAAKGLQDVASTSECFEEFKFEEKRIEELHSKTTIALLDHDYCTLPASPTKEQPQQPETKLPESPLDASIDHDYCSLKDGQATAAAADAAAPKSDAATNKAAASPSKQKKLKTPKKKKRDGSSSSSDSSSDSDSSSCTCGSNCSCSSSSGSSSSSSSSSDSDSSSSEGRRRIAARRERRKQKALNKKKESEGSQAVDVVVTDPMAVNPFEAMLLETDLDTDETETDEDFYDEHPQKLASKMLAEKRNQLMIGLELSNGTPEIESSRPTTPSLPEAVKVEEEQQELQQSSRKKAKSKKRKKKNRSDMSQRQQQHHQQQQLYQHSHNIPTTYYNHHQASTHVNQMHMQQQVLQQPATPAVSEPAVIQPDLETTPLHRLSIDQRSQTQGSGSDAESKRCSKRKRVRNKFYGYSSDEDGNHPARPHAPPVLKWRKADLPSPSRHQSTASPQQQFVPSITIKAVPSPAPLVEPLRTTILRHAPPPPVQHHPQDSESDTEAVEGLRKSSGQSESSSQDSDSDAAGQLRINTVRYPPTAAAPPPHHGFAPRAPNAPPAPAGGPGRSEDAVTYCYCHCPYDEVSEMIACDGRDCSIEWFHFECVGIMVPPKGKWYCPECRKKNARRVGVNVFDFN